MSISVRSLRDARAASPIFVFPRMTGVPSPPTSRAGTSGSAGGLRCARPSLARLHSAATIPIRPPATRRDREKLVDEGQYHYLIYQEPSSNLWRWSLYNPLGRVAAQSVEKYYNKDDC